MPKVTITLQLEPDEIKNLSYLIQNTMSAIGQWKKEGKIEGMNNWVDSQEINLNKLIPLIGEINQIYGIL